MSCNEAVEVQVPGKLMLVGEWAVLESARPECGCVVLPVDRFLNCRVSPSMRPPLCFAELPDIQATPIALHWDATTATLKSATDDALPAATELFLTALSASFRAAAVPPKPFSIRVTSDLSGPPERKLGLGSSAAVSVAAVTAGLRWCGAANMAEPMRIFRIAAAAQACVAGHASGSGFDIACAAFAMPLYYHRCDPAWLLSHAAIECGNAAEEWPGLVTEPLLWPTQARLLACFSGTGANTGGLIERMDRTRKGLLPGGTAAATVDRVLGEIGRIAGAVRNELRAERAIALPRLLRQSRRLLHELQDSTGILLETPALAAIVDSAEALGSADTVGAKLSGAGGGDCAIAVVVCSTSSETNHLASLIHASWQAQGFIPLEIKVFQQLR